MVEIGFPRWLKSKESACNAGDVGLIPGFRRSPGGGRGNPLQYSCLKNLHGRGGAWWATVHSFTEQLSRAESRTTGYLNLQWFSALSTH